MELMAHSSAFLLPTISGDHRPSFTYVLVVLNQRLPRTARLRVCADGGANRVYDEMPFLFPHEEALDVRHRYKPDVIEGDMDSIRMEVRDFIPACAFPLFFYYMTLVSGMSWTVLRCLCLLSQMQGTKVVDESNDQDTTDLHKCISYIRDFTPDLDKSNLCVLVAGALGGRFDHEAGNINVLYRFSTMRIILISNDCLIYLLPRSHYHEIYIQSSVEGPHCGLIPIGMPSGNTTTTGLQWDLNDMEMRFGGKYV
ncbi:hypothetical protein GH714_037494 [Hevea brasiliensis]|uniref:thiamine diphosphokinase n=1 Tax=Hevea brasiliensis TaxID=3981 RepID=A0A6A6MMR9_HEVBR|nr:hypothetical protein GH714_037494 [Hevea brasiliensis]